MPSSSSPDPYTARTASVELVARPDARAALGAWLDQAGTLHQAAASHPDADLLRGRGRVFSVPAPVGRGRWVVRHYLRGGAVANLLGDRYMRLGTPRPVREFGLGRALAERGIPTPAHVGAAVYYHGLWYRGDLVTEQVPDAQDMAEVLFPAAAQGPAAAPGEDGGVRGSARAVSPARPPVDAMRAAGRLIRQLHDGGVVHPDLNLKNVLLTGDPPRALVVDLDKARLRPQVTTRQRQRMLDRFWRSARKWEEIAGVVLPPELRRAFEEGYG